MIVGDPTRCDGLKVFKVNGGSTAEFCWRSESIVWVRQHWMRRAHLCTCDEDCPGCSWNSPRSVGFLACSSRYGRAGLLEVSPNAVERFEGLLAQEKGFRRQQPGGWWFEAARRGRRCPLLLDPLELVPNVELVPVMRVVRAIACLYRLRAPEGVDDVQAYFDAVKPQLRSQLADAVEGERLLLRTGRASRGS